MELRSQNYEYVETFLRQAKASGVSPKDPMITLFKCIIDVSKLPEYQPGFLLYSGKDREVRSLISDYGVSLVSGISKATWCTFVAYHILNNMGYNCLPILDKVYKDIGYTTAKEMYENAKADKTNCTELTWKDTILKANAGIPVLVAALGRGANQCHVGIVSPQFNTKSELELMIGQGGYYNGFGTLNDFFNKKYVYTPSFFELKRKV
jgi:hypothetical protein